MEVRLYDAGKKYENYIDRYTLYFPYPKWLRERSNNVRGCWLGCSPAYDGMIRCSWELNESHIVNSEKLWLGKKIKLETMPQPFQICAQRLITAWENALEYDDREHWEIWNRA